MSIEDQSAYDGRYANDNSDRFFLDSFGDCGLGDNVAATTNILDSIGKNVSSVIHSYGDTQGDQYAKVGTIGGITVASVVGLAVAGFVAYQLLKKRR